MSFPPGLGASTYFNSLAAIPYCFHMDFSDSHADNGSSIEVDLLGCCTKFFTETCDNRFHDHSRLLSWTNECRKFVYILSKFAL